jgi:hypothetical protein
MAAYTFAHAADLGGSSVVTTTGATVIGAIIMRTIIIVVRPIIVRAIVDGDRGRGDGIGDATSQSDRAKQEQEAELPAWHRQSWILVQRISRRSLFHENLFRGAIGHIVADFLPWLLTDWPCSSVKLSMAVQR